MGSFLRDIASIIGGPSLESNVEQMSNSFNELRDMFSKKSDKQNSSTMNKNRFEVIYEYGAGTRGTKIVEAYSEFDCQHEISRMLGRNDVRVLSVRRK